MIRVCLMHRRRLYDRTGRGIRDIAKDWKALVVGPRMDAIGGTQRSCATEGLSWHRNEMAGGCTSTPLGTNARLMNDQRKRGGRMALWTRLIGVSLTLWLACVRACEVSESVTAMRWVEIYENRQYRE